MWRQLRRSVPTTSLLLLGVVADDAATERSVSGSPLHTGGGSDAIDAPLAIPRVSEAEARIRLDGKLDDAIWTRVPAYDRMTLIQPDRGGTGRYRTQTFIFYTEKGLYVGAWNEQPPESLTPRLAGRDGWGTGDGFQVMIDSSGDGRYGYWFMVVLGGTLADGNLMPERRFSSNWDGPWSGETSQTDDGWTVEMFLPWSMIDMPSVEGPRSMGLLVTRDVAAIHERWAWPGLSWTQPKFISAFQPMVFEGVAPSQQISVFPYVSHLSDLRQDRDDQKVGLDVFWRPSTAFFLNAAINPDFGQVEADDIIVNLSAYETFFQEKRLFFTENQEVFRGSTNSGPRLLHTRRIGSSVGSRRGGPDLRSGLFFDPYDLGKPVDLLFAAKGVGQSGNWRWGALGVAENDTDLALAGNDGGSFDAPGRNFGVMRLQHENTDGGSRRALGWIGTVVDHPSRRAVTQGIDGHFRTADATWTWDGQLLASDVDGTFGVGGIGQLQLAPRRGDVHTIGLGYYDDDLDLNDAGYLWRNDYGGFSYGFDRRNHALESLRELHTQVFALVDFNGSGRRVANFVDVGWSWTFHDNTRASLRTIYNHPHWDDRNSRGNGDYRVDGNMVILANWSSDSAKRISSNFGGRISTEPQGGWFFDVSFGLTWRPVDRITFSQSLSYADRDAWLLWQGGREFAEFETEQWSPRARLDVFFTARQQLRIQTEWTGIKAHGAKRLRIDPNGRLAAVGGDSASFAISRMTIQVRYRWQIAPLSDLFVVYHRGGAVADATTARSFPELFVDALEEPRREALLVKLRYRFGR